MTKSILAIGAALAAALPMVQAESGSPSTDRPCFQVSVQNDRVNDATVRQTCERNFNRTVQAGARNQAQTTQSGRVNDNTVRQYQYDPPTGFNRRRGGD